MSLASALSIAGSGLAVVQRQISVVSQNVANASTTGYVREVAPQYSLEAGADPSGVASGPTQRALDGPLQNSLLTQGATVSGLKTTTAALAAVDAAQGTTGADGSSLASLAGGLQSAFTTLRTDPGSAPQQQAVLNAAQSLVAGIGTLTQAYTAQRQAAQDGIVQQVTTANQALGQIGTISKQIVLLRSEGEGTADLENQRDEQVATLGTLLSVHTRVSATGDMTVTTDNGLTLPTHGTDDLPTAGGPLVTGAITIVPGDTYGGAGAIPPITIGGLDVTGSLAGGSIGANITLRDKTLPGYQGALDGYAQTLATRFSGQGLALFTAGGGAAVPAPPASASGIAVSIQVNALVVATPDLLRDGTVGGGNTAAGNTTVIDAVLNTTFAPQNGAPGLVAQAATLVASQAQDSAAATASLTTQTGVQTTLQSQFDTASGVSVDQELSKMVSLQNAYGAGGKLISALQSMFNSLLAAVNP